jgi:hypothetical protein
MGHLLHDNTCHRHLVEFSQVINNLYLFAGIGVSGSFQHFATGIGVGPPAVAITGCTHHPHHLICNTEYTEHSIHWFLYDECQWDFHTEQFGVHVIVIQAISDDINGVNPYIHHLQHFHQSSQSTHLGIERLLIQLRLCSCHACI